MQSTKGSLGNFYAFTSWQYWQRHYVFGLSGCLSATFVRLFVWTDLVSVIFYEQLGQCRWNLQGIFTSPYWVMTWLDSVGQRSRSQLAISVANASMSALGHQSHLLICRKWMNLKLSFLATYGCCIMLWLLACAVWRFTGSDVRIKDDEMPYAHVAVAVEGAGWPNPDNIPLMITNTLIGTWDRSVGSASGMAGQLALQCSRDALCNSFQVWLVR